MGSIARTARRALLHANRSTADKWIGRGKAFKIENGKPVGKVKKSGKHAGLAQ